MEQRSKITAVILCILCAGCSSSPAVKNEVRYTPETSEKSAGENTENTEKTPVYTYVMSEEEALAASELAALLKNSDSLETQTLNTRISTAGWQNIWRIEHAACDALGWQYMDICAGYADSSDRIVLQLIPGQVKAKAKSSRFSDADKKKWIEELSSVKPDEKEKKEENQTAGRPDLKVVVENIHEKFKTLEYDEEIYYPSQISEKKKSSARAMAMLEAEILSEMGYDAICFSLDTPSGLLFLVRMIDPKTGTTLYDSLQNILNEQTVTLHEKLPETGTPSFAMQSLDSAVSENKNANEKSEESKEDAEIQESSDKTQGGE